MYWPLPLVVPAAPIPRIRYSARICASSCRRKTTVCWVVGRMVDIRRVWALASPIRNSVRNPYRSQRLASIANGLRRSSAGTDLRAVLCQYSDPEQREIPSPVLPYKKVGYDKGMPPFKRALLRTTLRMDVEISFVLSRVDRLSVYTHQDCHESVAEAPLHPIATGQHRSRDP